MSRVEQTAVEILLDGGIVEPPPETLAALETLLPQAFESLEVGVEELIKGSPARIAGAISGRVGPCWGTSAGVAAMELIAGKDGIGHAGPPSAKRLRGVVLCRAGGCALTGRSGSDCVRGLKKSDFGT
jgi:hypothetical protein